MVDDNSVALQAESSLLVKVSRDAALEDLLTKLGVLPVGTCEDAFTSKLNSRAKLEENAVFFKQSDGSVPNLLYRGVGLPDAIVAQIISVQPQHVLATWSYSKLRSAISLGQQQSTLSAIIVREKICQSLLSTLEREARPGYDILVMS